MARVARGDQAGDGGAVLRSVAIGSAALVGEVVAGDDLVPRPEAAAEGGVVVVDARVDDGDGHARAVDAVGAPRWAAPIRSPVVLAPLLAGGGGGRRAGSKRGDGRMSVARAEMAVADRQEFT